jgi:hypothetical protein
MEVDDGSTKLIVCDHCGEYVCYSNTVPWTRLYKLAILRLFRAGNGSQWYCDNCTGEK